MITNPVLPAPNTGPTGNAGVTFLQNAVLSGITIAIAIGIVIFFFMLIFGAIKWISSAGEKQAIETARGTVSNALIGIIILFSVFAVLQLIFSLFGIQVLKLTLPTLTGSP
ncbi:MAG: hypothetical protein ABSE04_01525 [Candidatus Microgenomates bacterium]|jgi:hypothetical protein